MDHARLLKFLVFCNIFLQSGDEANNREEDVSALAEANSDRDEVLNPSDSNLDRNESGNPENAFYNFSISTMFHRNTHRYL